MNTVLLNYNHMMKIDYCAAIMLGNKYIEGYIVYQNKSAIAIIAISH